MLPSTHNKNQNLKQSYIARYFMLALTTDLYIFLLDNLYIIIQLMNTPPQLPFTNDFVFIQNHINLKNRFFFTFRRIGHQQRPIQESCRRNGLNIRRIGWILSKCTLFLFCTPTTSYFLYLKTTGGQPNLIKNHQFVECTQYMTDTNLL